MDYRFIEKNHLKFGLRWLFRRMHIHPNAYYNYLKHRKEGYLCQKQKVKSEITKIYHNHNGITGYRSMTVYLSRKGLQYSATTIHKYMNKELGLKSIVRPKKPKYEHGAAQSI